MKEREEIDVCVLMGGTSSEREVSLRSGQNVYKALSEADNKYRPTRGEFSEEEELLDLVTGRDLVFNCLHGGIGENGTVQALLELIGVPYTGTGPLGSAIAMDKLASKKGFNRASVRTPGYLGPEKLSGPDLETRVRSELGFPVVLKPIAEGSSRGIKIVDEEEQLGETMDSVRQKYGEIYLEEYINGKEVTAGILSDGPDLRPLPLIETRVKRERFFNYRAKYTPGETEFICPARLPEELTRTVKEKALDSHREFCCSGYSRVDFIVDKQDRLFGLELNTLPGMTETSDLPQAAEAAGIDFPELVEKMADSALRENHEKVK